MDDLNKLKAQAYDAIVQIEAWQKKLQELNQAIAQIQQNDSAKSKKVSE